MAKVFFDCSFVVCFGTYAVVLMNKTTTSFLVYSIFFNGTNVENKGGNNGA